MASVLAAFCSAVGMGGERLQVDVAHHPLRAIKTETLVYTVSASAKLMPRFDLGTVTFVLTREERNGIPQFVIRAEAKGGVAAFPYDAISTCRLREDTLRELSLVEFRIKPEYKSKWLRFHDLGIDYLKHKLCDVPDLCRNPAHFSTNVDGTVLHVRESEDPVHYVWSLRERHRHVKGPVYDALGALYVARGFDLSVGGKGGTLRVVSKRDMWDIGFRGTKQKAVDTPAGTIDCIQLGIEATPANKHARKNSDEFEGPLGLCGHAELYLDRETGQAVRIESQIEIGLVFDVEIQLKSRSRELLTTP